jgi:hypothetical protein
MFHPRPSGVLLSSYRPPIRGPTPAGSAPPHYHRGTPAPRPTPQSRTLESLRTSGFSRPSPCHPLSWPNPRTPCSRFPKLSQYYTTLPVRMQAGAQKWSRGYSRSRPLPCHCIFVRRSSAWAALYHRRRRPHSKGQGPWAHVGVELSGRDFGRGGVWAGSAPFHFDCLGHRASMCTCIGRGFRRPASRSARGPDATRP